MITKHDVETLEKRDGFWIFATDQGDCLFHSFTGRQLKISEFTAQEAWFVMDCVMAACGKSYNHGKDEGRRTLARDFNRLLDIEGAAE